jgi:hypothetical protein
LVGGSTLQKFIEKGGVDLELGFVGFTITISDGEWR